MTSVPPSLMSFRSISTPKLKPLAIVSLALLLATTMSLSAQPQGYIARANGFDLDDDGIIGEPGVDDLICDDTSGGLAPMPEDIDFDGDEEEQWYVDCDFGTNSGSCGSPSNPCRTIEFCSRKSRR